MQRAPVRSHAGEGWRPSLRPRSPAFVPMSLLLKGLPWATRTKGQRRWTPARGGRAHGEATSSEARETENQRVSPRAAHGTRLLVDEMSMSVRILSLSVAHLSACLPVFRRFFWQKAEAASRMQARMLTRTTAFSPAGWRGRRGQGQPSLLHGPGLGAEESSTILAAAGAPARGGL